jgi:hypothetical protein
VRLDFDKRLSVGNEGNTPLVFHPQLAEKESKEGTRKLQRFL